uniref:EF-hand domain-containing protein n=1 Tax=Parascaris univalens TaxID=6257 RepID=A0A915AJE2_PARUN
SDAFVKRMSVATLDDDNVHVKELNRLFLGCAREGQNYLDADGLHALCVKLNLAAFADGIVERVLCGFRVVDFQAFKDRFVQLLPEIIDVNSSSETIDRNAEKTLAELGVEPGATLTRYKTRLLCENTPELNRLSVVDINAIFDRADTNGTGQITLNDFLSQYKLHKRLSQEVNFITDTFVPSVNLFESIDPSNSGTVDSQGLLEHWASCGISIEQGLTVLKQTGQPLEGAVNAMTLSGSLERQLSEFAAAPAASAVVRVALLSLHAFIDHLRCMVREGESRAEHLHKQLQLANQRRTLLIEELEHNQLSIEEGYEQRLRETEERYRSRVGQMEERFRIEKKELAKELAQAEEELSRARQSESASRNRLQLVERQCNRLSDEARELAETVQQMEQLNRQLRTELSKTMQPRPMDDHAPAIMWRHRVELLLAHNKRLRDKIDELANSERKKHSSLRTVDPLYTRWTSAFRSQLLAIRKRRLARSNADTLSEMESEPESIFVRARKRRLLKVRERKRRHEKIGRPMPSCSSSGENAVAEKESNSLQKTMGERELQMLLEKGREEEMKKLKEEHRKEIVALKHSASKALADALNDQERQITQNFEKERRQFEVKLASEKNALERKFAEEKMKLINRLQEEFEQELSRLRSSFSPVTSEDSRNYRRQIEQLESSLRGQRNGYEKKMADLKEKYRNELNSFRSMLKPSDSSPSSFIALVEKYRNSEVLPTSTNRFLDETKMMSIEKTSVPQLATFPLQKTKLPLAPSGRCGRCEMVDGKLKQIHIALTTEGNPIESGIEDVGSSADSVIEEKAVLKNENKKLKGRLELAKERVTELRLFLSLHNNGALSDRYRGALGGSENSDIRRSRFLEGNIEGFRLGKYAEMVKHCERLEADNAILCARLTESRQLVKSIAASYSRQLDETTRLGDLVQRIYAPTERQTDT